MGGVSLYSGLSLRSHLAETDLHRHPGPARVRENRARPRHHGPGPADPVRHRALGQHGEPQPPPDPAARGGLVGGGPGFLPRHLPPRRQGHQHALGTGQHPAHRRWGLLPHPQGRSRRRLGGEPPGHSPDRQPAHGRHRAGRPAGADPGPPPDHHQPGPGLPHAARAGRIGGEGPAQPGRQHGARYPPVHVQRAKGLRAGRSGVDPQRGRRREPDGPEVHHGPPAQDHPLPAPARAGRAHRRGLPGQPQDRHGARGPAHLRGHRVPVRHRHRAHPPVGGKPAQPGAGHRGPGVEFHRP